MSETPDEPRADAAEGHDAPKRKSTVAERLGVKTTAEAAQDRMLMARASAIGIQFAVSIGIGALGGHWLDRRLDTEPTLLLVGVVLGAIAAFRDLFLLAKRESEAESD